VFGQFGANCPLIVTSVPPAAGPVAGERDVTVAAEIGTANSASSNSGMRIGKASK
jgi:hypothetical protein